MSFITKNIAAITACISAIGTICSALIAGLANSVRQWRGAMLIGMGMLTVGASPLPPREAELDIAVMGLRNAKGAVMLCLTRRPDALYLRCDQDPARISRIVAARDAGAIHVENLTPGDYSLLVIHDENRNGGLDKTLGMPREGFGFSRNPAIRFGPPRYGDVRFSIPAGRSRQEIKLRYLL